MKTIEKPMAFIKNMARQIKEDQLLPYAAQASFYLLLTAIPFLLMLVSVATLIVPDFSQYLQQLLMDILPEGMHSTIGTLLDGILSNNVGTVLSTTTLVTLWAASLGIMAARRGVRQVYGTKPKERFFMEERLRSVLFTLVLIPVFLVTFALTLFGRNIDRFLVSVLPVWEKISSYTFIGISSLIGGMLLCVWIALFYYLTANRQYPFRAALPGALFTVLGWYGFSRLFSLLLGEHMYSYVYGIARVLMLIMFWMYIFMLIQLLGAEINRALYRWTTDKKLAQNRDSG